MNGYLIATLIVGAIIIICMIYEIWMEDKE